MRLNTTLFATSAFRLVAIYLVFFAVSVAALLSYVYLNTAVLLERQTDDTIRAEVQALADQYRLRGVPGLIDTIERRSRGNTNSVYILVDPDNHPIAGNLNVAKAMVDAIGANATPTLLKA